MRKAAKQTTVEKYVGKEFRNKAGHQFIVTDVYREGRYSMATVRFVKTGTVEQARLSHINVGNVRDIHAPTVYGVGIVGMRNALIQYRREYHLWSGVLERVFVPIRAVIAGI